MTANPNLHRVGFQDGLQGSADLFITGACMEASIECLPGWRHAAKVTFIASLSHKNGIYSVLSPALEHACR